MTGAMRDPAPDFTLAGIRRQIDDEGILQATEDPVPWRDRRRFVRREDALSRAVRKDLWQMDSRSARVTAMVLECGFWVELIAGMLLLALAALGGPWPLALTGGVALMASLAVAGLTRKWIDRRRDPAYYQRIRYQHGVGVAASGRGPLTLLGGWSGLTDRGYLDLEAERIIRMHGGLPTVRNDEISPELLHTTRALERMRKGKDRW